MGFLDFVKKQFIDIIQWTEDGDEVLAWRFPMRDMEIQQGAQLTVRETQAALFVHQCKPAYLFGPGHHTIKTQNIPLLTDLVGLSKDAYNATLYYEGARFGARVSAAHRNDYLTTVPGRNGNDMEGTKGGTNIDASASWRLNDQIQFTFEGLNLTEEAVKRLDGGVK